jgi:uncharacterized membrane protein
MSYDSDQSKVLSALRPLIAPSADLLLGVVLTASAVIGALTASGPLRVVLGLPLIGLLPGYAVVAAAFPAQPNASSESSPDLGARAALSIGISVAVTMLALFVLGAVGFPYTAPVVGATLGGISLLGLLAAGRRRLHVSPEHRFSLPFRQWGNTLYAGVARQDSPTDAALNVSLAVAVVLGVAVLGYALLVPASSASFSSFAILSDSGSGEPVAGNYSTNLTEGSQEAFLLSVKNHEHQEVSYTVVTQLQRVENASGSVTERVRLGTISNNVPSGDTWEPRVGVTPSLTGENLRLAFLLYTGEVPGQANAQSAEEHLYLWVDVMGK